MHLYVAVVGDGVGAWSRNSATGWRIRIDAHRLALLPDGAHLIVALQQQTLPAYLDAFEHEPLDAALGGDGRQRLTHALDDLQPVADAVLAEQADRRIPRTVVPVEQPSPVAVDRQ
jgi:hypothetical protein